MIHANSFRGLNSFPQTQAPGGSFPGKHRPGAAKHFFTKINSYFCQLKTSNVGKGSESCLDSHSSRTLRALGRTPVDLRRVFSETTARKSTECCRGAVRFCRFTAACCSTF